MLPLWNHRESFVPNCLVHCTKWDPQLLFVLNFQKHDSVSRDYDSPKFYLVNFQVLLWTLVTFFVNNVDLNVSTWLHFLSAAKFGFINIFKLANIINLLSISQCNHFVVNFHIKNSYFQTSQCNHLVVSFHVIFWIFPIMNLVSRLLTFYSLQFSSFLPSFSPVPSLLQMTKSQVWTPSWSCTRFFIHRYLFL